MNCCNFTYETDWYTKSTFSGRFLNYFLHHPQHQKIAMIYNLFDRAIQLANEKNHSNNIDKTKYLLKNNNCLDALVSQAY